MCANRTAFSCLRKSQHDVCSTLYLVKQAKVKQAKQAPSELPIWLRIATIRVAIMELQPSPLPCVFNEGEGWGCFVSEALTGDPGKPLLLLCGNPSG